MMRLLFVLVLYQLSCILYAQVVTVKDIESNLPIESVIIRAEKSNEILMTDLMGKADLSILMKSGKLIFSKTGYQTISLDSTQLTEPYLEIRMPAIPINLREVVISATRWSQSIRDVPGRITGISTREVRLQNPQTAADLLGISGEVFIQKSQQGGGSPMIRGFSANRLLYSVDGVRMNTAIFRAGNLQNVISLDPFSIEKTEVLMGTGSVIYGSDAIGGVMSFRTLTPEFGNTKEPRIKGASSFRYSSANQEKTGHLDVQVGWKKWAMVSSISSNRFEDLRMGSHGPDEYLRNFYVQRMDSADRILTNSDPQVQVPTGYTQINLMQKLRFAPNKSWDLQYGFHFSETSDFSRYDRLIETNSEGLPRSAVWNYGPQKWVMNQLSITHKLKNLVYDNMSIRIAFQQFEESRMDRNFGGSNKYRLRNQKEHVDAYSINTDFEKTMGKSRIFYGLESILNKVRSRGAATDIRTGSPIATPDRYPQSDWQSHAVYFSGQHRFSDHVLAEGGIRMNLYAIDADFSRHLSFYPFDFTRSRLQDQSLSGNLGIVFTPAEQWKIGIQTATGFRAPNVDDIGKIFDFAAGDVVVPNSNLRSEQAYNFELNVARILGNYLKLDFSAYYTYLDQAMVRRPFQVAGQDSILYNGELSRVFAIQNAAYADVYGFHLGFEAKIPGGFSLLSKYNFQIGHEEMDSGVRSRSRHAAPPNGLTRLSYTKDGLNIQLSAVYSSRVSYANLNEEERQKPAIYARDVNGNPWSPAWCIFNLKVQMKLMDQISVSGGVENLTDRRYRPYSSGIVAPGRNFILSLNLRF